MWLGRLLIGTVWALPDCCCMIGRSKMSSVGMAAWSSMGRSTTVMKSVPSPGSPSQTPSGVTSLRHDFLLVGVAPSSPAAAPASLVCLRHRQVVGFSLQERPASALRPSSAAQQLLLGLLQQRGSFLRLLHGLGSFLAQPLSAILPSTCGRASWEQAFRRQLLNSAVAVAFSVAGSGSLIAEERGLSAFFFRPFFTSKFSPSFPLTV